MPGPPGLTSNFSAADYQATVQRQSTTSMRASISSEPVAATSLSGLRRCTFALPATAAMQSRPVRGLVRSRRFADRQRLARAVPQRPRSPRRSPADQGDAPPHSLGRGRPVRRRRTAGKRERPLRKRDDRRSVAQRSRLRVCRPESVRVTQLCTWKRISSSSTLSPLSKEHCGRARPESISFRRWRSPAARSPGAPKVRAMEIIAELEPTARGAYCGSLGYLGFDGSADLSILIRTITASRGWWQFPVGGGIVAAFVSGAGI